MTLKRHILQFCKGAAAVRLPCHSDLSWNWTRQFCDQITNNTRIMKLQEVVAELETFAPTSIAESRDNVGLLIQPSQEKDVKNVFLTNDLTEPVLEEAIQQSADLIISYHPPLFRPFKRLTSRSWKERIAVKCCEEKIAVYSPHTSWDCIPGGINTWLLEPYGPGDVRPVTVTSAPRYPDNVSHSVSVHGVPVTTEQLTPLLAMAGIHVSVDQTSVNVGCAQSQLATVLSSLPADLRQAARITQHCKPPLENTGAGRHLTLATPLTVETAVQLTKTHLKMQHLRVALGQGASMSSRVGSVAVCAGSGASVLGGVGADLVVTGEMSHHECLDLVSAGVTVILADHSNTERGYLTRVKDKLSPLLPGVNIVISQVDRDPLQIM